jgi:hypothetical protein
LQILRGIGSSYPNLFGEGGEGDSGTVGSFYTKYGWVALINSMANDDRSKWDYFFDLSVIEFLNTVCFYKDKAEQERKDIEQMKRQHG